MEAENGSRLGKLQKLNRGERLWVVMPYQPIWFNALRRALSEDNNNWSLLHAISTYKDVDHLALSWRNYLRPHVDVLQS